MTRTRKQFAISFVLIAMLMTSCTGTERHQCADASAKIASTLSAIEGGVEKANGGAMKLVGDADTAILLKAINDATYINDQFVANVRAAQNWDASTKKQIFAMFQQLLASIDALDNAGVLHIEDPNTAQQFQVWMATIRIAVSTIEGILAVKQ